MALTGLDIYKQLPKKNCGECGPPTCLAFAMALAAGKASLDSCPYVTDQARENLASASAPPIKLVRVGDVELGDETVIFRHDKTFLHPTGVFIEVWDDEALDEKIGLINDLVFERVGQQYKVDGVALRCRSGDAGRYQAALEKVAAGYAGALILDVKGFDAATADNVVKTAAARKPLLFAATPENYESLVELAKKHACPLAVSASGLDELADLAQKCAGAGWKELVLAPSVTGLSAALADFTQMRRLAIKKKFRPLGYPTLAFTSATDPLEEIMEAQMYVAKYASAVVVRACRKEELLPLLSWRANIYTDPQKPIQVEAKVHEVGAVNENSPVYVTTNFSLTYYSVEGEVEGSKIPAYILPVDTDGTSVLTAWAAGKFVAETIADFLKKSGIEGKVSHRELVLPGHVAVLSGKLAELSGWKVVVGPREASGIPAFARQRYAG